VRFTDGIWATEHGCSTPRNFVHGHTTSLQFSASGPVHQDDLVRFELLLPGFFDDGSFAKIFSGCR
jgi:hypothetical protein